MKKTQTETRENKQGEMLPEYDFTGKKGTRGKYHQAYQQGHTVRIYEEDGSVTRSPSSSIQGVSWRASLV